MSEGMVEDRRRATDGFENRLFALENRVSQIQLDMERHNQLGAALESKINSISDDTVIIRDIMQESRAAFKLAVRVGKIAQGAVKYIVAPGALLIGAIYIIKGGPPPSWVKEWASLFH